MKSRSLSLASTLRNDHPLPILSGMEIIDHMHIVANHRIHREMTMSPSLAADHCILQQGMIRNTFA